MKEKAKKRFSAFRIAVLMMIMMFAVLTGNARIYAAQAADPVVTPVVKNGLVKEGSNYHYYIKGKMVTNTWKQVNKKYYWFKSNGNAVRNGHCKINGIYYVFDENACRLSPGKNAVVKVNGNRYFVDAKGRAVKGWNEYKNKMYYSYASGKCAVNTEIEGIKFNKYGAATDLTQARCKLAARKFIDAHTKSGMSNYSKLRTCFNYIMWYTAFSPRKSPTADEFKTTTWVYKFALDMFQTNLKGNCYGVSSCFAAVAKELGYEPYVVTITDDHSFVMINGLYYDNMYGTLFGASTRPYYEVRQKIKF